MPLGSLGRFSLALVGRTLVPLGALGSFQKVFHLTKIGVLVGNCPRLVPLLHTKSSLPELIPGSADLADQDKVAYARPLLATRAPSFTPGV